MNNHILKLLKIKDENIRGTDVEEIVEIRRVKSTVIHGILTYEPSGCPLYLKAKHNQIHKHGKRASRITYLKFQEVGIYLKLLKQRFKCMCCLKTFTAKTSVVDDNCYISNQVRHAIMDKSTQIRSDLDIANDCNVSTATVKRQINKISAEFRVNPSTQLPTHLAMDEFKSVKNVASSMSFIFINNETHEIIDILDDRTIHNLKRYFFKFDRQSRLAVKTVTIDMYEPYINLIKVIFPNAKIIFDRFHI